MEEREYKMSIGIRSYWITAAERDKYLEKRVKPGCDYVALRDGLLILPTKFDSITHISAVEISEEMDRLVTQRINRNKDKRRAD